MTDPINLSGSATWLSRPALGIDDEAGSQATLLLGEARIGGAVDTDHLQGALTTIATRDPALADATHRALTTRLSPVDAGRLASPVPEGGWIGHPITSAVLNKLLDRAVYQTQQGVDGSRASTGRDLAVPATAGKAPRHITFSRSLQHRFDNLWEQSFPHGHARERGGTLIFDRETGTLDLVNVGGLGAGSGSFKPDLSVPDPKLNRLLGVFHTHPYDSGDTGVSFSGADIAVMINGKQNLIMAQSGDKQFVMMRTAQSPTSVDYKALNKQQNDRIADLVQHKGMSFAAASSKAAAEVAKAFHLAYYEGSNGRLTRISP